LAAALCLGGCHKAKAVTQAQYDQLKNGMSQQEAEAVLGAPDAQVDLDGESPEAESIKAMKAATAWRWGDAANGSILIGYNRSHRIVYKAYVPGKAK
jgi:hypothetical protein